MVDVIAEVNDTIAQGVQAVSPAAEVIAWNWAWPRAHETEIGFHIEADAWFFTEATVREKLERLRAIAGAVIGDILLAKK